MVEDSDDDEQLVLLELRRNFKFTHRRVDTEAAMRQALTEESWDIVLSDFALPQFNGLAAFEVVRDMKLDLPFIIVSGTVGEEVAVAAMRGGVNDYVLKTGLARLPVSIERELRDRTRRNERRQIEEQLLISDRMASVGILAAGIAHEFNNPLAAIIANLELAVTEVERLSKAGGDGALLEIVAQLGDARASADRLRAIVSELRVFSRSADGTRRPVHIEQVLDSSLNIAANEIRHRARLEKSYAETPLVLGHEGRLGQVLLNLIINAAHAIGDGDIEQHSIRVATFTDDNGDAVIEVGDTGCGIEPEILPRIFDAFFTTKPPGLGTGLGLSICHRIVTELGGKISVESKLGKGSTFRVTLPAFHGEIEGPAAKVVEAARIEPCRRGRVLVVDDERIIGKAVERVLGQDHEVFVETEAQAAAKRIAAGERFDVILCDIMMPQMTGMDLHAELSRTVPEQAERMIFLTGGGFTPRARNFLDTVAKQRIEKPFDVAHLRAVVNDRIK